MSQVNCSLNRMNAACGNSAECKERKRCFFDRYGGLCGEEWRDMFLRELEKEIADLHMPGLPRIQNWKIARGKDLNMVFFGLDRRAGWFLSLDRMYLHALVPCEFGEGRCYRVAAGMDMILIATCEQDGSWPEVMLYKKR